MNEELIRLVEEYQNKNRIDSWKRKSSDKPYVYPEGQTIRLNLKKFLPKSSMKLLKNREKEMATLDTIYIKRTLFFNKTDLLCQYIDYYIEFFDPDKELPLAILNIKNQLDSNGVSLEKEKFINLLKKRLFKDTNIKENVMALVEYNYELDVTVDKKTGRVFSGPFDFTNHDARILLGISMVMKMVIPLISQYISTNTLYTNEVTTGIVTDIFMEIFYEMGDYDGADPDAILKKLYKFTDDKIAKHAIDHQPLWSQQSALRGLTENRHTDTILTKHLISNNMFKFRFDDNIISFLKSIVETQLVCTINRVKYKCDPIRVDDVKDGNGLSGIDKLEQSLAKNDESQIIRADKSLQDVIQKYLKEYGPISEDEIAYYGEHFVCSSEFQFMLLGYVFAKDFDGYTELKNMDVRQHIQFLIIAKRKLISEGYSELPSLLSSVTVGKISNRNLRNNKFVTKIKTSSVFKKLSENKYALLNNFNDDAILKIISFALINLFTYVEYDHQELLKEPIEFNEDTLGDELLTFFDTI